MQGAIKSEPVDVKLEAHAQSFEVVPVKKEEGVDAKLNLISFNPKDAAEWGMIDVIASGTNMLNNQWCKHVGAAQDIFHYLNNDGGVFFKNPDGSEYYYNPIGRYSEYTSPPQDGRVKWKNTQPSFVK